jgi:hypothetical protein
MEATTATIIAAAVGITGAFGGVFAGQWMSRSSQRIQWVLDNRKQECRELLTALSVCYDSLLKVKSTRYMGFASDTLQVDVDSERYYKKTEDDLKRIIGDRLFIAADVENVQIRSKWIVAAKTFQKDWRESPVTREFEALRSAIVRMATETQMTWWQQYLRELKDDDFFK